MAALLAGCGGGPADDDTLVVGMELNYPPFEMRNSQNQPDGISVRIAEALGEYLERPVRIQDTAWDGIIPALKAGKIDLIISSMTVTEERSRAIAFSDGYVSNGLCLLVGKDAPIQSAEDLNQDGLTLAVKLSTTGEIWAKQNLPRAKFIVLDVAATCALEVVQGRADAFIYDQISVYNFWRKYPEETRVILDPIRQETWGIGLRQEDTALLQQVNAFIAQFRAEGGFDRLAERYMKEEKETFESMGVPFVF